MLCCCVVAVRAIESIDELLGKIVQHVEDVQVSYKLVWKCVDSAYLQSGRCRANGTVGRMLMETISRVPRFDSAKYETMLNSAMQVCACVRFVCVCAHDSM